MCVMRWYCLAILLVAGGSAALHSGAGGMGELHEFGELDPSLVPSAAEIRASVKSWSERAAATPAEDSDTRLRELLFAEQGFIAGRRLQQLSGSPPADSDTWVFDSSQVRNSSQGTLQPAIRVEGCRDELASNFGADEHCLYNCAALQAHYFPQLAAGAPFACFVYDPNTQTWPNRLMDVRRDKLIWHSFLAATELSPAGEVNFVVGSELECVNVTVQTELITATGVTTEEETRCLLPGFHEHNHTVENNHTVTVVGYVQSELHTSAGGTTEFVVGECTDTLIRVHTSTGASDITWELDDNGHNGPWQFTSPSDSALYEHESCMFDNNFTIKKVTADAWVGTIEVVSYVPDKTIDIPVDQTWILQGAVVDGIPVRLDARLKSGDAYVEGGGKGVLSEANLVARQVRFTDQRATLDKFAQYRDHSMAAADVSLGAALEYVGGWGATLIFEDCVFDHMLATSGAAMYIHGQMDEWARDDTRKNRPQDHTLTLVISGCLFWELTALWVGGAARIVDVYPLSLTVTDSQFLDCIALVSAAINWALYGGPFDPEQSDNPRYGLVGNSSVSFSRNEVAGSRVIYFGLSPIMFITFPGHWDMGPGTARPEVHTSINVEELYCHDNEVSIVSCIGLETKDPCGGSCFNYTLSDSDIRDGLGTALWAKDAGAASYFQAESHQVVRVKFTSNGVGDATETAVSEGSALYIHARIWARLINISVVGNVASRGGGARLFGEGSFELMGCLFQSNVAWESGGAIYKTGIGPLFIHDSNFTMNNAVRQIQVDRDVVVHVFTGAYGSTGFHSPIWKLDGVVPSALNGSCGDDVIYGYSLDGNRTHEYSVNSMYAEVVATSSGPHTLWHGLVMHSGVQARSWEGGGYIDIMGILTKITPTVCDSRLRTDCQCSDSAGNLEPCVVRAPGCQTGYNDDTTGDQDNDGSGVEQCPHHSLEHPQMIWSKTEFNVPQGHGGALAVSGTSAVEITNSIFSHNYAGYGETISATSVESLKVLSTDFSAVASNTIFTESVPAYECTSFPCRPGERCTVAELSLHCNPCPPGQISHDGIDCQTCVPGMQPSANRTLCVACVEGRYSSGATGGICDLCEAGKTSAEDRQTCVECPAGTRGSGSTCEPCDAGHFSNEGGALFCRECEAGKISSEDRITCVACPEGTTRLLGEASCTVCAAGSQPNEDGRCVPCSEDGHFSLGGIGSTCAPCENGKQPLYNRTGCTDCAGGTAGTDGVCTLCQPGRHASSGQIACSPCLAGMEPTVDRSACQCKIGTYDSDSIGLISCDGFAKPEPSQNEECTVCPPCLDCTFRGTVLLKEGWAYHGSESTVFSCPYLPACPARRLNGSSGGTLSNQYCATGYDPVAPLCAMCASEYNAYKVGQMCKPCDDGTINVPMLTGFVAVALTVAAIVVSGCYEWILDNGMLTDLRIMIGLYQILGQADAVLKIDFPPPVPELISVAKLLFLDIRTLFRMDCFELGGFYAKLVTNLFVLPILAAFACYVYYLNEKKTVDRMVAEGVTDISGQRSASLNLRRNLMVGVFVMYPMMTTTLFSVPMCRNLGETRYHESDYWVSCDSSSFSLVIVFAALGVLAVPLGIPLLFFLRMHRKVQELGGKPNENAAGGAKLAADDAEDQSDQYAFLVQDYRPSHWYWETVSYMRKLCLNGWTVVVGRGTMGQIYFATMTSGLFLIWHMRAWPFKVKKHNVMEAICEATLLLMYTTCLLLRNHDADVWSNEWVSRSGYGWMLVGLIVIVCPSPIFYSLWLRANDKNQGDTEDAYTNPLGDGGDGNEMPQSAERRVRVANLQQRKSKSLAQELSKTQVQLSKAQAQLAVLKPQGESTARTAYSLDVRRPSQVSALKELVDDGMVEQETLQKAQHGFSKHIRDQIEDMEAINTSRESLRAFLNRADVRLGHHVQAFIDVGGDAMTAEDLRFLSEEDMVQVSTSMTKIETRRLRVAIDDGVVEGATQVS